MASLKKKNPGMGDKELEKRANKIYNTAKDGYSFVSDGDIKIKEESDGKKYIIGHISSRNIDTDNEGFTDNGWKSLIKQANSGNIKIDLKHEKVKVRDSITSPFARIIEAKENIVDGVKKLWTKAVINENYPNVKGAIYEIENKFLSDYSVVFKPLKAIETTINNVKATLFDELILKNVGIVETGANRDSDVIGIMKQYTSDQLILKEIKNFDELLKMAEKDEDKIKVLSDGFDTKLKELKDGLEAKTKEYDDAVKEFGDYKTETDGKIKELTEETGKIKELKDGLETITQKFKEYKDANDPKAYIELMGESNKVLGRIIKEQKVTPDKPVEKRTAMGRAY